MVQSCLARGGWLKGACLPSDFTQKPFSLVQSWHLALPPSRLRLAGWRLLIGWPCRGVAQSFHQYPLEMYSPKGGGVGEAKPWLSSGSPLDTFCWIWADIYIFFKASISGCMYIATACSWFWHFAECIKVTLHFFFFFIEAFGFCVQSAPHQRHCDKIGNLVSCIHL